MKTRSNKKYQQKELDLMCKTLTKTRSYIIFFFAVWQKPRKLNMQSELNFWLGGQNETEYNRISILLLKQLTLKRRLENKDERHMWKPI